jgi:hypothetical protein
MNEQLTSFERATAKENGDFIDLQTMSGYRLAVLDPVGKQHHFGCDIGDQELGNAVLDVLDASRFLEPAAATELRLNAAQYYEQWVLNTMKLHGYKSRRALFKSMRSCSIERRDGVIRFIPSCHEKSEGWAGLTSEHHVTVSSTSDVREIGAALRRAFDRCT